MSLLRTVVLEPSSHTNTKTVFRIPSAGKVLMPELRVCNFGAVTGGTADGDETYNYGQGIFSLLKAVRLYANNILIDQCQDCSRYLVLKNLNSTTNYCYDVKQLTLCSNVNMEDEYVTGFSGLKPIVSKLLGRLDLSDVLPFLNAVPMLYNMPELRIELEYNSDVESVFSADGNSGDAGFTFGVNMPTMLYTQEMDEGKIADVKGDMPKTVAWFTWEREFVQGMQNELTNVPRVRAFDSKFVDKLVVQKLFNSAAGGQNPRLGFGRSDALGSEKINYLINGSRALMFNGHDLSARRSAQVSDLLGPIVTPFNAWDITCAATQDIMFPSMFELTGSLSWDAISVGKVINRLDLEIFFDDDRIGADDSVDVWVWGACLKFLNITDKGQIVVGYQANGSRQ
jgi:hypothetical protein